MAKNPQPLIVPDYKYYGSSRSLFSEEIHQQFRDPYIFKCHLTNQYQLIFSATSTNCSSLFRGCIGRATSQSIEGRYVLSEPLLYPVIGDCNEGAFYEIERAQIILNGRKYYLLFSAWMHTINPKLLDIYKEFDVTDSSLYCYTSDDLEGPFVPLKMPIAGSGLTGLYGTNFAQDMDGNWFAYGWYPKTFTFEVSPKFQVIWDDEVPKILVPSNG